MEVLSTVAAAELKNSRKNSRKTFECRKLSALDWERRTEPAFSAISRRFEDPEAGFEDLRDRSVALTATPWCNCSSNARTLALRKRIRSSLSWKVPDDLY